MDLMNIEKRKVMLTETILRDAHQSQAATRMRIEEMLGDQAVYLGRKFKYAR